MPPEAGVIAAEYAVPSVPPARGVAGSARVGAAMVSVYAWLPENGPGNALPSVAVTVKLKLPPAFGVPVTAPPADSVRPAGNAPAVTAKL